MEMLEANRYVAVSLNLPNWQILWLSCMAVCCHKPSHVAMSMPFFCNIHHPVQEQKCLSLNDFKDSFIFNQLAKSLWLYRTASEDAALSVTPSYNTPSSYSNIICLLRYPTVNGLNKLNWL